MKTEMVGFTFESRRPYITWNALLKLIKKTRTKAATENRTFYVFVTPNNIYSQVTICLLQIIYYFILSTFVRWVKNLKVPTSFHFALNSRSHLGDWDDDIDELKTLRLFSNKRWKLSENLSVLTKHDKKCYKSEMSTFALKR